MKPLFLRLSNIGPFVQEEIDFAALQDMFLVTGRTGSGKTTIFDAMTYALYGETAGYRSRKDVRLHSDYAPEDAEGSVEFIFLLNARQYRIIRTVERSYTTKTGKKARKPQTLELYGRNGGTEPWEPREGKLSELNEKIQELIGLSKDEFSQIVLLPQGEFAEFLHEDPRNRKNTLAKLFPVEFYSSVCQQARSDADAAQRELDTLRGMLAADLGGFDKDEAARRLQEISGELGELQGACAACSERIRELSGKKNELASRLEDARAAAALQARKAELEAQRADIAARQARLRRAQEAALLGEAIRGKEAAGQRLAQAQSRLAAAREQLSSAQAQRLRLAGQEEQQGEQQRQLEECGIALHDVEAQLAQAAAKERAQLERKKAAERIEALYIKTAPAGIKAAQELADCTAEKERGKGLLLKLDDEIQELRAQQQHEKDSNAAASLASLLAEGSPCPVCGSTTHPSPAAFLHTGIDFDERIAADEAAASALRQQSEQLSRRESQLQEAGRLIALMTGQLLDAAARAQLTLPAAAELPLRTEPTPTPNRIAGQQTAVSEATAALAKAVAECGGTADSSGTEALHRRRQELAQQKAALRNSIERFAKAVEESGRQCSSLQGEEKSLSAQLGALQNERAAAEERCARAIAGSSFGSEEEARNAIIPAEETARLSAACESWQEAMRTVEAQLNVHRADAAEQEELAAEQEKTGQELTAMQQQNELLVARREQLAGEQATLQERLQRLSEDSGKLAAKEKEYGPLIALSADINGSNPKKIQLDSWVLGTYLEEVVNAANLRFRKVSAGRYSFILRTEKEGGKGYKGLDITVSDSYTGRERSTASLSGGETFMASLSLALALTDVVQQKSGGIRLDSLFIDEGFGSLDGETLDGAISILNEVREQRMVGIISHVESLASAIPSHIAVSKTNAGSSICIRQA